jgi:uncharacterized protein (TIGR00255 family)
MLASMTGYGKAECVLPGRKIIIEIKSLNSKQLDISTRLPSFIREREIDIRNEINHELERGKIECYISTEIISEDPAHKINKEIVKNYIKQLQEINNELNLKNHDQLIEVAMRLPDALKVDKEELATQEWIKILESLHNALADVKKYRLKEGTILEDDIKKRIHLIQEKLDMIKSYEEIRIKNIRDKLTQNLKGLKLEESYDPNRFEQELIFWIERLDITEEKVRIISHCNYFLEIIHSSGSSGKKLGFISQEIGRELNTLGAKAGDSDIQKLVVEMKDELEKIKEQLNNIL